MGINDELDGLRQGRAAERGKEHLQAHRAAVLFQAVRDAFDEFGDALRSHRVPTCTVVGISQAYRPATKKLFRTVPGGRVFEAHATGMEGWVFHGIMLLTDGRLMKDPYRFESSGLGRYWGVMKVGGVDERGSAPIGQVTDDQAGRLAVGDALRRAGLGGAMSVHHLYIPSDHSLEEATMAEPTDTMGFGSSNPLRFQIGSQAEFALYDHGELRMVTDRREHYDQKLTRLFAEFIDANGSGGHNPYT